MTDRQIYRKAVSIGAGREAALNLVLLKRQLKDAATIGYARALTPVLKKNGYQYLIDKSYVVRSIHGFLEETTKTPIPGARLNRRFYAGYGLNRQKLGALARGGHFHQGLLFCFPLCCNLNFCRKASLQGKGFVDILKEWIVSLPCVSPGEAGVKSVDYRLIGGVLKYLQPIRVVQHIPCSACCAESVKLAERNLALLREIEPSFYRQARLEFLRPVFLYGNDWNTVGILQLGRLKKIKKNVFSGRVSAATDVRIRKGMTLTIRLVPHKGIEISSPASVLLRESSSRRIPWSYCCLFPSDTLAKKT
ncbi:MAG: hypothetical protein MJA29_13580 [Candidatus Omnitrophica bacterium]|nr:hypothetical protein [Candidatus Omnitrophota bacterium]